MTVDTAWTPPGQGSWPSRRPVRSDVMMGCECGSRCDWLPASLSSVSKINCEIYHTIKVDKCKKKTWEKRAGRATDTWYLADDLFASTRVNGQP